MQATCKSCHEVLSSDCCLFLSCCCCDSASVFSLPECAPMHKDLSKQQQVVGD